MKIESPKNDLQPFLKLFDRFKPLKKLIKKNPLILDIGANIGDSIFEFNKILKPKKIYAFEPQKHCVKILHKRFGKNKQNIYAIAMVAILSFTCLLLNICSAQFSIVAPVVIISSTNKICLSFIK